MFGRKTNIKKVAHKFRLYKSKSKCRAIDSILLTSGNIWNHLLGKAREHYKKTGKYIGLKGIRHEAKKERRVNNYWKLLNSQSVQDIADKLHISYDRFFKKIQKRPPKFKPSSKYKSILFTQAGYKVANNEIQILAIKKRFKFVNSRGLNYFHKNNKERNIYNARIKRDSQNRYWVIFTVKQPNQTFKTRKTRGAIGVDFGLKTYMTIFNGKGFSQQQNPQFLKENLRKLRTANKSLSRKKRGSNNCKKAIKELLKVHRNISNRRSNWQWELAHKMCRKFKFIGLEDLNIKVMQRLWGRKISDFAHSEFIFKLKYIAKKYGTVIQEVDRFYASSKTCCKCGYKKKDLKLKERTYQCNDCGLKIDRDRNASINIRQEAIRLYSG